MLKNYEFYKMRESIKENLMNMSEHMTSIFSALLLLSLTFKRLGLCDGLE